MKNGLKQEKKLPRHFFFVIMECYVSMNILHSAKQISSAACTFLIAEANKRSDGTWMGDQLRIQCGF